MILQDFLIFMSITTFVLAVLLFFYWLRIRRTQQISERLDKYSKIEQKIFGDLPQIIRSDDLSKIPLLNKILKQFNFAQSLNLIIDQAGMEIEVGRLLLMMLVSALVGLILTLKLQNFTLMSATSIIAGCLPLAYVLNRRKKRRILFEHHFPDSLDMLRNAIRAGFGFVKGMKLIASESPDPVGIEFRKTHEEINLGISFRDALINFSRRIDSVDLKLFVTALLIQRESGGNLSEILFKISTTIRERFKLIGQIRVFTAQGRLSGIVLGLLPFVFGGIVSIINPDYIAPLFTESTGRKILLVAFLMQIIGFIIIRRIIKIKLV